MDRVARLDLDRLTEFHPMMPKDHRQALSEIRSRMPDDMRLMFDLGRIVERSDRFMEEAGVWKAPKAAVEFDMDAALEATQAVFVEQAKVIRGLLAGLASTGEGVEVDLDRLLELVYGRRIYAGRTCCNPTARKGELKSAARDARSRMDERNTPLLLVIDRYWMKVVRRPEPRGAN